jgi:hypothetical protein
MSSVDAFGATSRADGLVADLQLAVQHATLAVRQHTTSAEIGRQAKDDLLRADSSLQEVAKLSSRLAGLVQSTRVQLEVSEEEAQRLRKRVAAMEANGARGPAAEGCACSSGCLHRAVLATNVIDQTFNEQRRQLKRKLVEAEKTIEELRSGAALQAERQRTQQARDELEKRIAEFDAEKAQLLSVMTASRRLTDTRSSLSVPAVAAKVQNASSVLWGHQLLVHAQLMADLREAQSDMKALFVANALTRAACAPPLPPPVCVAPPSSSRQQQQQLSSSATRDVQPVKRFARLPQAAPTTRVPRRFRARQARRTVWCFEKAAACAPPVDLVPGMILCPS